MKICTNNNNNSSLIHSFLGLSKALFCDSWRVFRLSRRLLARSLGFTLCCLISISHLQTCGFVAVFCCGSGFVGDDLLWSSAAAAATGEEGLDECSRRRRRAHQSISSHILLQPQLFGISVSTTLALHTNTHTDRDRENMRTWEDFMRFLLMDFSWNLQSRFAAIDDCWIWPESANFLGVKEFLDWFPAVFHLL